MIKHIIDVCGVPFREVRERVYKFEDVRGSYIIPTQIEACLQACLLELDVCEYGGDDRVEFSYKRRLNNDNAVEILSESLTKVFSFRAMIREYLSVLIDWPKQRNSELRHVMTWAVKYCGFFSLQFQVIHYGEDIFPNREKVAMLKGRFMTMGSNPNERFLDCESIFSERKDTLERLNAAPILRTFVENCLFF